MDNLKILRTEKEDLLVNLDTGVVWRYNTELRKMVRVNYEQPPEVQELGTGNDDPTNSGG